MLIQPSHHIAHHRERKNQTYHDVMYYYVASDFLACAANVPCPDNLSLSKPSFQLRVRTLMFRLCS
jgi:hypothetical protein